MFSRVSLCCLELSLFSGVSRKHKVASCGCFLGMTKSIVAFSNR